MFVILYFVGYLFAFAWYCPIACGRRFAYALYIPFLISIFLVMRELVKNQTRDSGKVENKIDLAKYFTASHLIMAFSLIFNIWVVTNNVLFIDAYGS
jgi:Sec-independent protein secretion pathway component TatC